MRFLSVLSRIHDLLKLRGRLREHAGQRFGRALNCASNAAMRPSCFATALHASMSNLVIPFYGWARKGSRPMRMVSFEK